jgi:hypothetical protein
MVLKCIMHVIFSINDNIVLNILKHLIWNLVITVVMTHSAAQLSGSHLKLVLLLFLMYGTKFIISTYRRNLYINLEEDNYNFDEMKDHYYSENSPQLYPIVPQKPVLFSPNESFVYKTVPNKINHIDFEQPPRTVVHGDLDLITDGSHPKFTIPERTFQVGLFFGNVPIRAPLKCAFTLQCVINKRLLAEVNFGLAGEGPWEFFNPSFKLPQFVLGKEAFDAWLTNQEPRKRRRAEMSRELAKNGALKKYDKIVIDSMAKLDEKFVGPWAGREIRNVPSSVSFQTCPYTAEAMKRLKAHLQHNFVDILGIMCLWEVASGYSAQDIVKWKIRPNTCRFRIITQGDDSLVEVDQFPNKNIIVEGDFSSFDLTQREGPVKFGYRMLLAIGIPQDIAELIDKVNNSTIKVTNYDKENPRRMFVKKEGGCRHSGNADTSLANSCVSAYALVYALTGPNGINKTAIEQRCNALGLDIKVKIHDNWRSASFLKGHFWKSVEGDDIFGPAPGRILKLGSSLTPFCDIVHPSRLANIEDKDQRKRIALAEFLNAQAANLRTMAPVPILRAYVKRFYMNSSVQSAYLPGYNETVFRSDCEFPDLDEEAAIEQCLILYPGFQGAEEIYDLEKALLDSELFSVLPGNWQALLAAYL